MQNPPQVLCIQLLRFDANGQKINQKVDYPPELTVPNYRDGSTISTTKYTLSSIIVHEGNQISSGHYVCYVNRSGRWFYTSDTVVKEVSQLAAYHQAAYMLFYMLGHKEEEPVALKDILKLHREVVADIELKIRNEDNNFKKCYYNFLRTYRKIITKCRGQSPVASLASAFVHFGKQQNSNVIPVLHNGSRIRVQPTSVSCRKSSVKSSSAQPSGPKPRLQTGVKRQWQAND